VKELELSVAGKTFMAGEYLALAGGPALVLATEPCFRLKIQAHANSENPFHPLSPAGQFWTSQKDFFSNYKLHFQDPYQVGGFGASSAQFALLHAFWQMKEEAYVEAERFLDWHQMLTDYRSLPVEGLPPSGADVIGAVSGGLTWFDRNNGKVQTFSWPFQEIQFFVAHTGQKLATHEHLKKVSQFETSAFAEAMSEIHQGLIQVDFETFLSGMINYRTELERQGRVASHSQEIVESLRKESDILFAKGCGAMGADVILVLCLKEASSRVKSSLQAQNLNVIADSSKIAPRLQIRTTAGRIEETSL
jgi:mevalonate kinase